MKKVKNPEKFWKLDDNGKSTIIQSKLTEYLNLSGFAKAEISKTDYVLVQVKDNLVREISDYIIVNFIQQYLQKIDEPDVLEAFSKGVSNYISKAKLRLLKTEDLVNDRDDSSTSRLFFKNIIWQVGKNGIKAIMYEDIPGKIWESRIIPFRVSLPIGISHKSQFEIFCFNLAGKSDDRFKALRTNIGYLLHRNNDPANAKAIIFVDENISFDGTANGGTGKSLLLQGIGKCREMVVMDGKNLKRKSWFKNQGIEITTDLIFYDDVTQDFNLEELYSMITTGMVVEKKYKAEFRIPPDKSPKIAISSNYIVNGTGGSTDIRRRCEFEVANYYTEAFSPFDEFGNLFFQGWDEVEWDNFYLFMAGCIQAYLKNGLIIAEPINLKRNKLINATSQEFIAFMQTGVVDLDKWICKKSTLDLFISEYPQFRNITSHQFTKWMKMYCIQSNLNYKDKKSGPKFEFILEPKVEDFANEEMEITEKIEEIEEIGDVDETEVSDE